MAVNANAFYSLKNNNYNSMTDEELISLVKSSFNLFASLIPLSKTETEPFFSKVTSILVQ